MKGLKRLMLLVLLLAASCAAFLDYMGMFGSVNVTERQVGPFSYAYEEFTGPYKNTMPVFARVTDFLNEQGIIPGKSVGVFFDNPSQVPPEKLRSNCGAMITETDPIKLSALQVQLKLGSFEATNCVTAEFPIRNTLSYILGPMKIYPLLSKYIKDNGYQMKESYEIYDTQANKIVYFIPASRQQ